MKTELLRGNAVPGRRWLCASLLGAVGLSLLLLVGASAAWASGGRNIATAPRIAYGVQEFGNTATDDGEPDDCDNTGDSWWMLPVSAGDHVTIDYEGYVQAVRSYPMGTTDFSLPNTDYDTASENEDNGQNEFSIDAPATGEIPLDFQFFKCAEDGDPAGPYDLTARVQHGVRLSVTPMSTLGLSGTVAIGARNPAGAPISDGSLDVALQILVDSKWVTIGHAAPSAGAAAVSYAIPSSLARRRVRLRAVAAGAAYLTATSVTQKVALPPALHLAMPTQSRVRRHGKLVVSAAGYDGAMLSDRRLKVAVQLRTPRGWKTVGSRWVENSRAPVRLGIPRRYAGRRVALRAVAGGDYPHQVSAKRRYRVR